jgi:prepilin-type N-terminal cleavage/methylation domain-containing protein/prepilin-type processing-associated H-X9-DG protein
MNHTRAYRFYAAFTRVSGRKTAFTLIEVLVVVSIIAVLVSVLLPSLANARGRARRAVCVSHLHQLAIAAINYSADYNDQTVPLSVPIYASGNSGPTIGNIDWCCYTLSGSGTFSFTYQGSFLQPYVVNEKTLQCPEQANAAGNWVSNMGPIVCHYRMGKDTAFALMSSITDPAETVLFLDSGAFFNGALTSPSIVFPPSIDGTGCFHGVHNHVGNVSFYDGHVEALIPQSRPVGGLVTGDPASQWAINQKYSLGSLCYGTIDPAKGNVGETLFFAYATSANLDFYFYYNKAAKQF